MDIGRVHGYVERRLADAPVEGRPVRARRISIYCGLFWPAGLTSWMAANTVTLVADQGGDVDDVVIAGAGPVGLWLARELRLAGAGVVVLERATERSPHSKALTMHPRSLEVLAMRGVQKDFLAEGVRIPNGHFGALENRLDFAELDTEFPFTLAQPQVRTEELFEQYALAQDAEIRQGHEVVGIEQDEDSVAVKVSGPKGQYRTWARFVVGCDGAGSAVRKHAGIAFPGMDSSVFGYLGDVALDNPPKEIGFSANNARGSVMVAPLPGGLFRFVGVDPERQDVAGTELGFEELQRTVSEIAGTDFGMRDPVWLSRFGNATRQAENYRDRRVLLAGDAAHIHFPTGGVGLNVGIQDVMNLGWKLAAHVRGRGGDDLLDSYHDERHPVGEKLLENSLAQTAVLTGFSPEGQALRSLLNQLVADHRDLSDDLARRLSALDVAYPPAIPEHPLVGRRVPDLALSDSDSLYSLLHSGRPVLLDTTGSLTASQHSAERDDVVIHSVRIDPAEDSAWKRLSALLVRPDGHVAWAAEYTEKAEDVVEAAVASLFRRSPRP